MSSSSKRWTSASGAELSAGRSSSPLHPAAAALSSPARQSARRSVSRSDPAGASLPRMLWPSSSTLSSGDGKIGNKAPRTPPSPSPFLLSSSAATLADHLAAGNRDDTAQHAQPPLSRQRSCTELPRFATDVDTEARKIGKGRAFGRSMRFLPSTNKPAGVTLTPGRVAPSDLRRLSGAVSFSSLDAGADVASSGSECSDASRGSSSTPLKPRSPLLPRTSSVRLLGSSNTQWALSPGRRTASPPLKTTTTLATVPETTTTTEAGRKTKSSLISLGWGHIFNRRKHATDDASLAAAAATLLSSSPVSSRSSRGGGEAGHQMKLAHGRLLQWRFANAREDAVRRRKLATAEVELIGAWASLSEMRGKVARKRVQLEKEKMKMKLDALFSSQMKYLESWEHMESKHASALASTVACARAAVYRLPLTNCAKVSTPWLASNLQHALDLVTTTKTIMRPLGPTAQETMSVVSDLARVAREEQVLLQECLQLLGRFSSLQVKEQSLRCHMVQSSSSLLLLTSVAVE